MSEAPTKFTRRHKLFLASLATVSLSLGAAGIVSAAQNPSSSSGGNAPASVEVPGVDCADGLIAGTTIECDGGPTANAANDPAEADNGTEKADKEDASDEVGGVDCENGIIAGTTTECDGGPSANPQDGADDAAEPGSDSETP